MTVAALISYNADEQAVLFDILYDRYERKSTIIVSQKSPVMWIKEMQGTTLAESSVNRAIHNNYSLTLKGNLKAVKKIQGLEKRGGSGSD
ncbi:MAG: ATP-binding protein [Succinatimonas sp.]|nr:ATP-binding protein [Succinatimonas sp.]